MASTEFEIPDGFGVPLVDLDTSLLPADTMDALDALYAGGGGGGGAVDSVNGQTGVVVLDADDIADGTTNHAFTAADDTKLAGIATGATANSSDATLLARANHTGTQLAATISDFNTAADARVVAGITGKSDTGHTHTAANVTDFNAAALAAVPAASETVVGKVELATAAETTTGTDTTRAVHPAGVKAVADTKAALSHTHAASDIASGTVATARLGSGSASGTTFLRGDQTWATPSGSGAAFPATWSGGPSSAYVTPVGSSGSGTAANIGNQPAGQRMVWFPIYLGACTITGVAMNLTTAGDGSAIVKIGLYDDWGGVRPKSLLTTLASITATGATGEKAVTGLSYAWAGGTLWVGAVEQGHSSTCAAITNDTAVNAAASTSALNFSFPVFCQDSVSGALPSTPAESATTSIRPRIYLIIQ
jgi:hypothetical protein